MQSLRIPAREIAINETDFSVAAVLFAEQVQRPVWNIFCRKCSFDIGEFAQVRNICGVFTFGFIEHTCLHEVANFFDDFQALLLRILSRDESL